MYQLKFMTRSNFRVQRGLSLVELLITASVLGALVAMGYPSYVNFTVNLNRSTTANFVKMLALRQEQNGIDNIPYADQSSLLGSDKIPSRVSKNYVLTVTADNTVIPAEHSISATPTGAQLSRDTECGIMKIEQTGIKTISGTGTAEKCW